MYMNSSPLTYRSSAVADLENRSAFKKIENENSFIHHIAFDYKSHRFQCTTTIAPVIVLLKSYSNSCFILLNASHSAWNPIFQPNCRLLVQKRPLKITSKPFEYFLKILLTTKSKEV